MKHLIATVGILLVSSLTAMSQAQVVKSHDLSLKGTAVFGSARGVLMLVGKAEGSLSGSFEMSIWYNPVTNKITGGTWKLMVPRQGRDGATKAQGAITGSINGGTVAVDEHGKINSAEGIQLSIRRSAGQYSHIVKGSGTFSGTLSLRRKDPFMGKLNISF